MTISFRLPVTNTTYMNFLDGSVRARLLIGLVKVSANKVKRVGEVEASTKTPTSQQMKFKLLWSSRKKQTKTKDGCCCLLPDDEYHTKKHVRDNRVPHELTS
ncbi:hypothetical protein AC249_AIPGENE1283 [Exaiptasia diaphana]|nr:hypothetical protein AC249_AIPGENE1283 [Exaiptasia diaphana]